MKFKLALLMVVVFLGVMVISFKTTSVTNQLLSDTLYPIEMAPVSEYVQKAKEQGKKKVIFPAPVGIPRDVQSLSEALADYRIVVAQLVAQKSYPQDDPRYIITWHKFKVIEDLSQDNTPKTSDDSSTETLPKEIDEALLPVEGDEVLIRQAGGILNLDGVTVIQETDSFPFLSIHKKYLLFLPKRSFGKAGEIDLGPWGIFAVTEDGLLNPIVKSRHPISRDIQRYHGRSLDRFKATVSRHNSKD